MSTNSLTLRPLHRTRRMQFVSQFEAVYTSFPSVYCLSTEWIWWLGCFKLNTKNCRAIVDVRHSCRLAAENSDADINDSELITGSCTMALGYPTKPDIAGQRFSISNAPYRTTRMVSYSTHTHTLVNHVRPVHTWPDEQWHLICILFHMQINTTRRVLLAPFPVQSTRKPILYNTNIMVNDDAMPEIV